MGTLPLWAGAPVPVPGSACMAVTRAQGRGGAKADLDKENITKQHIPATGAVPAFTWKDYLPRMFKGLREAFGIDNRWDAVCRARGN